ncbi:MAG: transcriptional repressor [Oscillospiraceae bacterium]|nr:transcriptional repressor [Oscillospiraceae bacterium]
MKNTIQKTAIMNALMALDHPTADEVYECVHSEFPSISKATVYRILNRISEEGEILHLQIPGGADRFDTTLCAHHHLKCNKCGKICDVSVPELDGIEKRIKEENGFAIGGYRLVFSGLCSDCIFKKLD